VAVNQGATARRDGIEEHLLRIERGSRLIKQNRFRLLRQRPKNFRALLLITVSD